MIEIFSKGGMKRYKAVYVVFHTNGYTSSEPLYVSTDYDDAQQYREGNGCSCILKMPLYGEERIK